MAKGDMQGGGQNAFLQQLLMRRQQMQPPEMGQGLNTGPKVLPFQKMPQQLPGPGQIRNMPQPVNRGY